MAADALQTADDVKKLLGIDDKKPKTFIVGYFAIKRPEVIPLEVAIIARERAEQGRPTEASYKLRSSAPLELLVPAIGLKCPLPGAQWEKESDVVWGVPEDYAAGQSLPSPLPTKQRESWTCSTSATLTDSLPKDYQPKPPSCNGSEVIRFKGSLAGLSSDVKVELWKMPDQGVMLEVSTKVAEDSLAARQDFYDKVVTKLVSAKARPSLSTKTELNRCP